MKAKTAPNSKQKPMKKTSTSRKQSAITKKPKSKIKKSFPEAAQSFRQLFKHMSSCAAIYTPIANGKDFIIKNFNKAAEKAEKIDRGEIIGKSVLKVFPGVKKFGLFKVFQQVWKTGKPQHHPIALYKDNRISGWKENYVYKLPTGEIVAIYNDITKQKQAEHDTQESESRFRNIIEQSKDGVIFFEGKTQKIILGNAAMARLIGCPKKELVGRSIQSLHPPKEWTKVKREFQKHVKGKISFSAEIPVIRNNGYVFYADISSNSIMINGKEYISAFFRDITERKQAEKELRESEAALRVLMNAPTDSILLLDSQGVILDLNAIAAKRLKKSRRELIGTLADNSLPKNIATKRRALISQIFETGREVRFEDERDGTWYDTIVHPITNKDNTITKVAIIARDITARKRSEEALRESEENFRRSLDDSPLGIRIVTVTGETLYANKAILDIYGYGSIAELESTPLKQRYTPESYADFQLRKKKRERGETRPSEYEIDILTKNGEIRHVQAFRKEVIWNGAKQFQVIYHDITKQKQAEKELQRSEEKYRSILETMEEGYYEVDLAGNLTFANDAMCRIHGYSKEELIGMNFRQYTSPQTADTLYKAYNNVYKTGIPSKEYAHNIIRKSGEERILDLSFALRKDFSGKKIGFGGIVRDITDRKQAEEKLRINEQRLKEAQSHAHIGSWELDINTQNIYWSEEMLSLFELDPSSRALSFTEYLKVIHPDDAKRIRHLLPQSIANQKQYDDEYRIVLHDGSIRWIHAKRAPIFDEKSKMIKYAGTVQDITERKRAEMELRHSEERYRTIIETIQDGYVETDITGNWTFVNDVACGHTGYSREELLGMDFRKLYTEANAERTVKTFTKIYETGIPLKTFEIELVRKDKTIGYYEISISLMKDSKGKSIGFRCISRDITDRKRAEEELHKSHEELETMIESSPVMIYFKDAQNRFLRVNQAVLGTSGLTKEEIEGKTNEEINPKQAAKLWEEDKEIIATGKPLIGNLEIIKTRKGSKILRTDKVPYRDKQGNIIGIVGFSVDITEQKQAQDELSYSEEKYRSLVENSQEGIYQGTVKGRYETVNPAFAHMLGYDTPEEMIKTITNISKQLYVHPEDRKKLLEMIDEDKRVTNFEVQLYKKDGGKIWASINMHEIKNKYGHILYYQGTAQDITERKMIEGERQENFNNLRKALGATINAMAVTVETRDPYTAGHQRRVADLARAIATEMDLPRDQIEGLRMASMIHDIGKISIPSEILTKPTQLTALEFNLIKTHPDSGYAILKDIEFPWPVARIVLEHHERINGSGYPLGLKEEQILLESKILAVADVVEAISSHRPYRAAYSIDVGLDEITKNRGTLYDPDVVDACLRLFREKNYNLAA